MHCVLARLEASSCTTCKQRIGICNCSSIMARLHQLNYCFSLQERTINPTANAAPSQARPQCISPIKLIQCCPVAELCLAFVLYV
jgi:hypothetical protein